MGDPSQYIGVLRDLLLATGDNPDIGPWYQVQSAVYFGQHSGRLMTEEDTAAGRDMPGGLLLTMRDGSEYRLTLTNG